LRNGIVKLTPNYTRHFLEVLDELNLWVAAQFCEFTLVT
jgi:hypothetical protein